MKKLIFLLLLVLPFMGFGQAAYLMEFTNPNGSKVVFNLNDVRSCVAEGSGSYLFTRTGSGKTQVQESPVTIALNSCGNIVLFTVYSPGNQFNTTKQMGVNPNYVVGVVSNTSGDGVLKMTNPTENFTTTSTYDAAVALLSICVSGGGGGGSLTSTYVGFGNGLNILSGEAGFSYDATLNRLAVDTVKTKRISSKTGQLELLNDTKFNAYPNTRNDAGAPINILSTSAAGVMESHPVSELRDSIGTLDTIATYTALRAYVGKAKAVYVQDWTYTFNSVSYTTLGGLFRRVSIGTENGGTLIAAANGVKWARDWDKVRVQPEWWVVGGYDAEGYPFVSKNTSTINGQPDGIYNESDRINSAVSVVGAGGVIVLYKNKTYNIDRQIDHLDGQTFEGNNATLFRISTPNVFLAALAVSGATSITVNDASALRVGINLLILTGPGGIGNVGYNFDQNVGMLSGILINNISGNVVSFVNALPAGAANGVRVILNNGIIGAGGSDKKLTAIKQINFDGNKSGNPYSVDWRLGDCIHQSNESFGGIIENSYFKNTPAENITGTFAHIKDCRFENLNGSLVHMTASTGRDAVMAVENCYGNGFNLAGNAAMNHSEAIITSSAYPMHVRVFDCNFKNGNEAVFSIQTTDGFDWSVENNYFDDCKWSFIVVGGSGVVGDKYLRVNNNTFKNTGPISIATSIPSSVYKGTGQNYIKINDNTFINSVIYCNGVARIDIDNNNFYWDESLTPKYAYGTDLLSAQQAQHYFVNFDRVRITNNVFEAPLTYASYFRNCLMLQHSDVVRKTSAGVNTEYLYPQEVKVFNNTLYNVQFGIVNVNTTVPQNVTSVVEAVGWEYVGNTIYMSRSTGASGGTGIYVHPGVIAERNTIYVNATISAFCAIMVKGVPATGTANTRLRGGIANYNKVMGCAGATSVADMVMGSEGTAVYNQTVVGNQTFTDMYTSYTGGFSGFMSGNFKFSTTNYPTLSAPTCPFYQGFAENKSQY